MVGLHSSLRDLWLLSFRHLFSMALSLWITIISICMFSASSTGSNVTMTTTTVTSQSPPKFITIISISIPIILVLLAAIIIPVVVIYRRKRGRERLHQDSICYGNAGNVSLAVEQNVYKTTEKEKDNYGSMPPKEEPIYINVQGKRSMEQSADGDRTENIYCNVGYNTQQ
ncbi:hypothetical protein KOW79_014560 [Hemibagrus wyckioides]|uniref:Uncharacterized protein n=1 Tax=Hemibagrus wyckioides TaxID=337641 RepID=A0A9D3NG98_9TELE|nr:hypothetical protein KOW79_014560 [Hemibagrus wyckioides]